MAHCSLQQGKDEIGTGPQPTQESRIHTLLIPSVFVVLLDQLHSKDVQKCRLVCKAWNRMILRRSSPFLNPRIMDSLVPYLSEDSILKARQVCTLWNQVVTKSERWKEPVEIGKVSMNEFFSYGYNGIGNNDFQRFEAKFGDPANISLPFAFTQFTAPRFISLSDPSTENFLRTYGRFIEMLGLYRCKWDLEALRTTLFEFTPNLKHFHLVCGIIPGTQIGKGRETTTPALDIVLHKDPGSPAILTHVRSIIIDINLLSSEDNPRAYVTQFITEFFISCPNVEELNIDVESWYSRSWITDFIVTNASLSLKKLKVISHVIDLDLPKIVNLQLKQLPLTTLKIRIRYKDVTIEALHELLSSLKHTLTFLQLMFKEYKCAHEFPSSQELYKLKHLVLWEYKGQLDFLKDFPSLESLLLGEIELNGQKLFDQRDIFKVLLPNLRNLTFKDGWEYYETGLFS